MHHYKFKFGERITDGTATGTISGGGYDYETGRKRYGYFIGPEKENWIYESEARLADTPDPETQAPN